LLAVVNNSSQSDRVSGWPIVMTHDNSDNSSEPRRVVDDGRSTGWRRGARHPEQDLQVFLLDHSRDSRKTARAHMNASVLCSSAEQLRRSETFVDTSAEAKTTEAGALAIRRLISLRKICLVNGWRCYNVA
jgi:hypothetical protein